MDFESFKRKSNYFAGKDIYFPLHQIDSFVSPIFNDNRMKFKLQTQQSHQSPKSTTQNTSVKQVFPEKKKKIPIAPLSEVISGNPGGNAKPFD